MRETFETESFAFFTPFSIVNIRFFFYRTNPTQQVAVTLPETLPETLLLLLHMSAQESIFFKIYPFGQWTAV